MRRFLPMGVALAISFALAAQTAKFDVVSVKPSADRGDGREGGDLTRFTMHNVTVKSMILRAYDLQETQLLGGPAWIEHDSFDVDARTEHQATPAEMLAMLRSVLTGRFGLVTHSDTKTVPVYTLTVAKGGPKFGPYFHALKEGEPHPSADGRFDAGGSMKSFGILFTREMALFDPWNDLALQGGEIPPIVDKTGLSGEYCILLNLRAGDDWPALVEHQLGLKLELKKETVPVLFVDHVAKPTEN